MPCEVRRASRQANNFLCHMYPADAERCLRNIARDGPSREDSLFVSGIDLDVRTRVAVDAALGTRP